MIFDLESYDDDDVAQLSKFHRDKFDLEGIMEAVSSLKFTSEAAHYLRKQMAEPDDDLIKLVGRQIYDGNITKTVIEQLRPPIKQALQQVIRDKIQERLNVAFAPESQKTEEAEEKSAAHLTERKRDIETTEEELQAFYIVRAVASEVLDVERITIRDAKSYCAVFVDDNNRKPVCRFYFNAQSVKYIGLFDEEKREERKEIIALSDIFKFKNEIVSAVKTYA